MKSKKLNPLELAIKELKKHPDYMNTGNFITAPGGKKLEVLDLRGQY
jgi:hypothetical protein